MTEAAVCHVELHLTEDGLRLDAPPASVPESIFRCQQFAGFSFVLVEPVVYLDRASVVPGFVAQAPQRASFAVLCSVACAFTAVAACCL